MLEFADRLLLRNGTGKTVTVYGYSGEPYARVLPNGAAEQNTRSPAVYLNTNFYADVTVPASASATAPPRWEAVDRTGQFEWHDHRIHWISPVTPPEVKNTSKRTKIFNWTVPRMKVGDQPGAIGENCSGCPKTSSAPTGAIVAGILIVLIGLAIVVLVRRRRARAGDPPAGAGGDGAGGAAPHGVVRAMRRPGGRFISLMASAVAGCWLLVLLSAPGALAHAQLLGTSPAWGARSTRSRPR